MDFYPRLVLYVKTYTSSIVLKLHTKLLYILYLKIHYLHKLFDLRAQHFHSFLINFYSIGLLVRFDLKKKCFNKRQVKHVKIASFPYPVEQLKAIYSTKMYIQERCCQS